MTLLVSVLKVTAVAILLAVLAAFFFPRTYHVQRSVSIAAPAERVFRQVADLRQWKNWAAWHEREADMQMEYSATTTKVGDWSRWTSATQGSGQMTLTELQPNSHVVYRLEFPEYDMASTGAFEIAEASNGVDVTWSATGDLGWNPFHRWFGLFFDRLIGPDFEAGLAKLKRVSESHTP